MTTVLIAANSALVVIATLAWAREFRLRRALQSLLSRVFNHWSSANDLAVLEERSSFFFVRVDLLRESGTENLVLVLQLFNIFGQFAVRGRSDQCEEWVENLAHWCNRRML